MRFSLTKAVQKQFSLLQDSPHPSHRERRAATEADQRAAIAGGAGLWGSASGSRGSRKGLCGASPPAEKGMSSSSTVSLLWGAEALCHSWMSLS